MSQGALYLIPCHLGDNDTYKSAVPWVHDIVNNTSHYIVENLRTTRRYLRRINRDFDIDNATFFELNKHTDPSEIGRFLEPIKNHHSIGLMSEAGCPGIADPGADVVAIAHERGIRVIPIPGPSSILLTLISSGFNGQDFAFTGYLPRERKDRIQKLKTLEGLANRTGQTQLFMETPFRANHMLEDILQECSPSTKMCLAIDITLDTEKIKSQEISVWKKNAPNLSKRLCIFAFGK